MLKISCDCMSLCACLLWVALNIMVSYENNSNIRAMVELPKPKRGMRFNLRGYSQLHPLENIPIFVSELSTRHE